MTTETKMAKKFDTAMEEKAEKHMTQLQNAKKYKKQYSEIIKREIALKAKAAQIKEELDLIKSMKQDYIDIFGEPMSNEEYHDMLIEVGDTIKLDADKVKKAFPDWAKKFGKTQAGYSYIQTKLTNQTIKTL